MPVVIGSGPQFGDVGSGSTVTTTTPGGTGAGDFLLAIIWCDNDGSAAAITSPADSFGGWQLVSTSSTTVSGLSGFAKIFTKRVSAAEAAAGMPSSYVFGVPPFTTADACGYLWRYLGVEVGSPFAAPPVWSNPGTGATASLIAPSVQPPVPGLLMCVWMIEGLSPGTGTITGPGGMASGSSQTTAGFLTIGQGSTPLTPPGPTGTRTGTASGAGSTSTQGYMTVSFVLADEGPAWAGWGLGPSTFARPWLPTPPPQIIGADAPFVPPTGVAVVGVAAVGVSAAAAVVKVVAVSATCGLGLAGTAAARRTVTATGRAAVGVASAGAGRKTAPAVGLAAAGLAGTVAGRKQATAVGRAVAAVATYGGGRKSATAVGRSAVGLAGAGAGRKLVAAAGRAAVGFAGSAGLTSVDVRAVTARAFAGFAGMGGGQKRSTAAAGGALGLASAGGGRKVAAAQARAAGGLTASGAGRKVVGVAGRAVAGLAGRAVTVHRVAVAGRATIGAAAVAAARKAARATGRAAIGFYGQRIVNPPSGEWQIIGTQNPGPDMGGSILGETGMSSSTGSGGMTGSTSTGATFTGGNE